MLERDSLFTRKSRCSIVGDILVTVPDESSKYGEGLPFSASPNDEEVVSAKSAL